MINEFSRTELIFGKEELKKLQNKTVAVFGVGGVGSFAAEAIARCGIKRILLIDNDVVSISNINRQLIALHSTVGMFKVEVMKKRIADINPDCVTEVFNCFYTAKNADEIPLSGCDYIIDAIDTVSSKLVLIENANRLCIPIISCMGAGNKLNPTMFEVADIYQTSVCPLAKVMRKELRAREIKKLKVVYSKELPCETMSECEETTLKRQVPGSVSFVPSVAGLIIAGEVIKDLADKDRKSFL